MAPKRPSASSPSRPAKQQPKRRRHEGQSSQRREPTAPAAPPAIHPCLQFTAPAHRDRYERLFEKSFEATRFVDWGALQKWGLAEEVAQLMEQGGMRSLFDIREPTYRQLTLEFLSTFVRDKKVIGWNAPSAVEFQLGGRRFQMSITEFGLHMGLYTEEEVQTEEYGQLQVDFPQPRVDSGRFWYTIASGGEAYSPTMSKASRIRSPALRYLHKLLVHSICGKRDSTGVVSHTELFYLYCMVQGVRCNTAYGLAWYFDTVVSRPRVSTLLGGAFITRLAVRLGLFEQLPAMDVACAIRYVDEDSMKSISILVRHGRDYRLAGQPEPPAPSAAPPDTQPEDPPVSEAPSTDLPSTSAPPRHPSDIPSSSAGPSSVPPAPSMPFPIPPAFMDWYSRVGSTTEEDRKMTEFERQICRMEGAIDRVSLRQNRIEAEILQSHADLQGIHVMIERERAHRQWMESSLLEYFRHVGFAPSTMPPRSPSHSPPAEPPTDPADGGPAVHSID